MVFTVSWSVQGIGDAVPIHLGFGDIFGYVVVGLW